MNSKISDYILYYPSIEFQSMDWVKSSILLWDNVYRIVPKGYEPNDLESIASVCTVGDTGCNSDELYLRKEANSAFQKMVKSGKKHVKIVAISGYRTYDYQLNL